MYEELLMSEEGLTQTANKMIFIGKPIEFDTNEFTEQLKALEEAAKLEKEDVRKVVKGIVSTYQYNENNK